ncbi:DUF2116 family Zn-ribbon domain-containing protein [Blautia sp.]|uniref:DUF2116 family Zn-ribbon domain-containing protein n=1 Tax=Blautia sp. TaxID=1955243 RepID=UPI003522DE77
MKKCRYCGKELDSNLEFCSSECENSYRKIIEKDRHKIKYFISGIILGFLAMFYGVVSSRNCMIGSGIIVMGSLLFCFHLLLQKQLLYLEIKGEIYWKNTRHDTYSGWNMGRVYLMTTLVFRAN